MNDRIRMVRESNELSMRKFGNRIGISSGAVSMLESGKNNPSEQTIRAICSEFHVSREWLEYGVGDMEEKTEPTDVELSARILTGQNENKRKLLRILADMPDELLDSMMDYLEGKIK